MNRKIKPAEQANRLISHNNASVKTAHWFQQSLTQNAWGRRSLTPFANRKEECERHKKLSKKFVNQAVMFVNLSGRKNLNRVHQSSRYCKFGCKNSCSLCTARLEFQVAKNELIDSINERVLLCLPRSIQSPQESHVRCVEIKCQRLSRTEVRSNPVKLYFRSNVGVP